MHKTWSGGPNPALDGGTISRLASQNSPESYDFAVEGPKST